MTRVKIAFAVLGVIMFYCGFSWFFVSYGSDRLIALSDDIASLYEKGDYETAMMRADELNAAAKTYAERAGLFVHDTRLSALTVSTNKIKAFIKGRSDETYAELASIREDIEDFINGEIPRFHSIL
jgi:cell division protein FtsB